MPPPSFYPRFSYLFEYSGTSAGLIVDFLTPTSHVRGLSPLVGATRSDNEYLMNVIGAKNTAKSLPVPEPTIPFNLG